MNASSFFSGQSDSDTPTTLSLTIPASQVASLSQASLHSAAGSQAVTFIPQQADTAATAAAAAQTVGSATTPQTVAFIPQSLDNSRGTVAFLTSQQADHASQVPVSAAYLTAHGQSSNILSMLDSALQASAGASTPVIRVGTNLGTVQIADSNQTPDTGIVQYNCLKLTRSLSIYPKIRILVRIQMKRSVLVCSDWNIQVRLWRWSTLTGHPRIYRTIFMNWLVALLQLSRFSQVRGSGVWNTE